MPKPLCRSVTLAKNLTLAECVARVAREPRLGFRLASGRLPGHIRPSYDHERRELFVLDEDWFDYGKLCYMNPGSRHYAFGSLDEIPVYWAVGRCWEVVRLRGDEWRFVVAHFENPDANSRRRRAKRWPDERVNAYLKAQKGRRPRAA